jgi:hypothetical protein
VLNNNTYLVFNQYTLKTTIDNAANLKLYHTNSTPVFTAKSSNNKQTFWRKKSNQPDQAYIPPEPATPTHNSSQSQPAVASSPVTQSVASQRPITSQLPTSKPFPKFDEAARSPLSSKLLRQQQQRTASETTTSTSSSDPPNPRKLTVNDRIEVKWPDPRWPDDDYLKGTVVGEAKGRQRVTGSHLVKFDMDQKRGIDEAIIIPLTSRNDGGQLDEFRWLDEPKKND